MLDLFENTLGHMFRSTRSLSRHVRTVMPRITHIPDEIEPLWGELEGAVARGETEAVIDGVKKAREHVMDLGLIELLDLELDLAAMKKRFQARFARHEVIQFLQEIAKAIKQHVQDPNEQKKLLRQLGEELNETKEMHKDEFGALSDDYSAAFEQTREAGEHRWKNRARGIALLARSMHYVYAKRRQYREVKREMSNIIKEEEKLLHVLAQYQDKMRAKLEKESQLLAEDFDHLIALAKSVFSEFTLIQRTFVTYFFVIFEYHKLILDFLAHLKEKHFPGKELEQLYQEQRDLDAKLKEKEGEEANVTARMARLEQAFSASVQAVRL